MGNSPPAQLKNGPKNILSPPIFSGFTNTISLKMALRILTAHLCSADFFWLVITLLWFFMEVLGLLVAVWSAVYNMAPKLDLHQHWLVPAPTISSSPPPQSTAPFPPSSPIPPSPYFTSCPNFTSSPHFSHFRPTSPFPPPPCPPCSISDHIGGHVVFLKHKSS